MSQARENIFKAVTAQPPTTFDEVIGAVDRFNLYWAAHLDLSDYWDVLPNPSYTFGHAVIDDYNFDDSTIDVCLKQAPQWLADNAWLVREVDVRNPDISAQIMYWGDNFLLDYREAIEEFLKWLKTLPEEVREQP
jgi:hypothetical protein